ncbi:metallophosphoesterase [Mycobacterium sp. NPDC050551]|uniref:metallophosphoesterase n=1 Tax=Mycobacterium sp. NPDC050551 TaxID=3155407 RepID=UPI0034419922
MKGYDIIGDVHGCASLLKDLLERLGYQVGASGAYEQPGRQAVFVGDLVDRGGEQLQVLETVKRMVDSGSAQIVMGNHEFNAVAYDTEHPDRPGEYLRPRSDKNKNQHQAFLDQVDGEARAGYLEWFAAMPLWLDLGGIRVVHACWHEPSVRVVEEALGSNRFSTREQFVRASDKSDPLYDAIEVLLKGPEIDLARHGLEPYYDKDGHPRSRARVAWWRENATTLRQLAVLDGNFRTASGEPYPELPDVTVDPAESSYTYRGDVPVFYGHYWRSGSPEAGSDYTRRSACVDFSAVKTGNLVAYRWDGEDEIQPEHYVLSA